VAAQIQDVLVLLGLLLVAVGCLWYARMGLQEEEDAVLVVGGILAAAGFALAAPVYWWLGW
jgi:drug/metabolite transporter (DMT)-like permease